MLNKELNVDNPVGQENDIDNKTDNDIRLREVNLDSQQLKRKRQ